MRRTDGVMAKQFREYFKEAFRQSGVTGMNMLRLLESAKREVPGWTA